jgi:hypothetical protein
MKCVTRELENVRNLGSLVVRLGLDEVFAEFREDSILSSVH